MSRSLSLRSQVLVLFGGSLLALLLIALLALKYLHTSVDDYRQLMRGPLRASLLIDETNVHFKVQVQEWKNVLLRGANNDQLQRYWGQFENEEAQVQKLLGELAEQPGLQPAVVQELTQLRSEHAKLGQAYRQGRDAFLAAAADPRAGDRAVQGIDRATSERMNALVERLRQSARESSAQIDAESTRAQWLGALGMLLFGVLTAAIALWLVNRRLVSPITRLTGHVIRLSEGDFSQRIDLARQDELGHLGNAANVLRDTLAETFERLQNTTGELDRASDELSRIAAQMAQGTRDQFDRTDQAATAMTEMSATAQEVARHAGQAAQAADDADASAQQGEQVMRATIDTITGMREEVGHTAERLQRLHNDSERIGKVLEVIRGIADQTNLLALNAAIEAARAGDAGRGFAVVADEVRTLAQRTASSTAEIHQIIDTVQTGASEAVRAIGSSHQSAENGVAQVQQAGERLRQITEAIEAIRDMNRQIATAAEEQTSVAEDISRNLTDITAIATTNQQDVARTEAASGRLHDLSGDLQQALRKVG